MGGKEAGQLALNRSSIESAHSAIKEHIHLTPVMTCQTLNDLASTPQSPSALFNTSFAGKRPACPKIRFFFKCENFQRIGAFKIRGATHALSRLSKEDLAKGVVTNSSGNHAQALALAARRLGINAHIVMPTISAPGKIAATKGYGAKVYFSGSTSQEREAVTDEVRRETGALYIPPYNHPDIILGQGTMALELEVQAAELIKENPSLSVHHKSIQSSTNSDVSSSENVRSKCPAGASPFGPRHLDAVIAPLGGGGMLSGIATALHPTPTRVYGAEPSFEGCDDGRRGLAADPPSRITHVSSLTIADGLRTPIGEIPWGIISDKRYVKGVFAVTEEQIKAAMRLLLERMKVMVEPSAAVGLAVALFDEEWRREAEREGGDEGWDVGIVLSGGNVAVEAISALFTVEKAEVGVERAQGKVGLDGARVAEDVPG